MKASLCIVLCQFYILPTIKITYSKILTGDLELIICWLKWELVITK
jgi:hypothetical protein